MIRSEQVTDFKLEHEDGTPVTTGEIVKAVEAHCKELLDGESFCDRSKWFGEIDKLPERWRHLIAWWMEGDNEGWYVHLGVMVDFGGGGKPGEYWDMGFAKLWSPETAKKVATEAQRFLTAARWN